MKRLSSILLVVMAALVATVAAVLSLMSLTSRAEPATGEFRGFTGPGFLVASDADMTATAYATGVLERVEGVEDALSVVRFPDGSITPEVAQLDVSNSVLGWPSIVEVSPDGEVAYVVEPRGTPPPDVESYDDIFTELPAGSLLGVVDVSNPSEPEVLRQTEVGTNPSAVSVSPDGEYLAIGFDSAGNSYASQEDFESFALLPTGEDRVGEPIYLAVEDAGGRQAGAVSEVEWHPSGSFLALTINNSEVAFFEVVRNRGEPRLEPLGERFTEGTEFTEGVFSPDGEHFIVEDVGWGEGATGYLFNRRGTLTSIRFDEEGEHELTSTARVGLSPEGLAMSPDGALIATVNMRRTYLTDTLPVYPARARSSVSLVEFDAASGELTTLDEYFYEGLLPEDAVFDAEGESLAVTIYNYDEELPEEGAMEFWNVTEEDGEPALERTGFALPIVRGPHTVEALPPESVVETARVGRPKAHPRPEFGSLRPAKAG